MGENFHSIGIKGLDRLPRPRSELEEVPRMEEARVTPHLNMDFNALVIAFALTLVQRSRIGSALRFC
jgi:hypothetical protein